MWLIIFGPPGSGKGTQSRMLRRKYGIASLATGDILRLAVENKTKQGRVASSYMDAGQLVPDEVVIAIIAEALDSGRYDSGFVLDGFPRNQAQAHSLSTMLREKEKEINAVLVLNIDDAVLNDRISGRFSCSHCGASYHRTMHPTKKDNICDECGKSAFIARGDDDIETLKKRVRIFHEETEPVLPYYAERGLVYYVDGHDGIEVVSAKIAEIIDELKAQSVS